jgi:hypothetical protein
MALKSFGWKTVASAGTPERLTATRTPAQSVLIQVVTTNTGDMYIGTSASMDPTDGTDMVAVLSNPTADAQPPSFSLTANDAANGIDLSEIWIDSEISGEEVLVSYLEG